VVETVVDSTSVDADRRSGGYSRRERKNSWRRARQSSASTPGTTSKRWLSGSVFGSRSVRTAPPLGSSAP